METNQLLLTFTPAPKREFLDFPFRAQPSAATIPVAAVAGVRRVPGQARVTPRAASPHRNLN